MRRSPLVLLYVMLIVVTMGPTSISLALMEPPASLGAGIPDGRTPLTTVEQRQTYYDQLLDLSPEVLWRHWQEVDLAGDSVRSQLVIFALAKRIRVGGGEEVYQQVRALLQRRDIGVGQRIRVAQILSEMATPEAAAVLVEVARSAAEPPFEVAARNALVTMSDNRWQGRFHPELSPILEAAWLESGSDNQLTRTLALALAKVGAESGVELLLRAVAVRGGQPVEAIASEPDRRAAAALGAMTAIRNPAVLPVLARYFRTTKPMDTAFVASGEALASMGHPEATRILLQWVESAPDEAVGLASRWAGRARDQQSMQLWREAVIQQAPFGSPQVHERVREVLERLTPREE